MRLLNVHTFEFHTFLGDDVPNYSIASHRWVSDECTIKDIIKRRNTESNGYKKVEGFCAYVRQANELYKDTYPDLCCDYLWIDTCCIDQKSSLEVDTAIRSMFQWYNKSVICYAYLADVEPLSAGSDAVEASLRDSVWFSRGWTLQELLAPRTVVFLTKKWEVIGHKCTSTAITDGGQCPGVGHRLNGMISEISGIPELVLYDYPRSKELSIEERMGWAAKRKTTRQEDSVYCLLGIFEIHMPVMYGEGDFAQIRLRNEIEKKVEAWEKGQRAGVQTTYNKTAPCAVIKTTSHLPTVSQAAHGDLPAPIDNRTTPSDVMVTSARQDTESSQATSQQGTSDAGASEAADELRSLNVGQRGATSRVPMKNASTPNSSSRPDDEENFRPPPRSMTFNTWREPYTRRDSPGQGIATTSWAEEPEDMEVDRSQGGAPPMPPPRKNPPLIPNQKAPPPPTPQRTPQSTSSRGSEPQAPSHPSNLPPDDAPPPDYDSIWDADAAQQRSQQPRAQQPTHQAAQPSYQQPIRQADNYPPPAKSPSWSTSQDSFGTAPSRAQTWSTAMTDTAPSSRNDNWSPPSSDYPMPTLEDVHGQPNTTTQSHYGGLDVPLSARAQRRLEHTIAREERKEKRRERHRSKKAGAAGTVAGSTRGDDDYDSEGDDLVSNTGSSFSRSTDPRSYSTGGQAPPPMPHQQQPHMYDVVQDARRQDARRRFFESGGGKDKPRAGSTSSGGKNSTTERSLSDLADSLPSGLRLTKTALRMLDSKSPTLGNGEGAADQQTVAPSEAGTSATRTKPVGRRELKQILKDQKGSASHDQDGKKLSARDRLLGAVSSHLRNA